MSDLTFFYSCYVFYPVCVYTAQHNSRGILYEMFVPFLRSSFVFLMASFWLTCLSRSNTQVHVSLNCSYWVELNIEYQLDYWLLLVFTTLPKWLCLTLSLYIKWERICCHLFHWVSMYYVFETFWTTQTILLQKRLFSLLATCHSKSWVWKQKKSPWNCCIWRSCYLPH